MITINLILADDHAVVRAGTRQLLERQPDLRVIGEAADGEEAVRLAKELKPDLVVMDAVRVLTGNGPHLTHSVGK